MRNMKKTFSKMRDYLDEIARRQHKLQRISDATSAEMLARIMRSNTSIKDAGAVARVARLFIEAGAGCGYTSEGIAKKLRIPVALARDITLAMEAEGFIKEHHASCSFWSLRLNMEGE